MLLAATAVVGVFYGPLYLFDLWGTRAWARGNPDANIVMWVIFGAFWIGIPALIFMGSLGPQGRGDDVAGDRPPPPAAEVVYSPSEVELARFLEQAKREADYECGGTTDRVVLSAFRHHPDGSITANCRVYPRANDDRHWVRVCRF